ncbi:hypothetical protein DSO57_1022984 [Entomophthora muscae]|uniref:Uncharacterized protein n=1 Tax=Entomophthora muscae TaxID=34485 RepID=A0ACC2SFP0_9FUNG|nr:hypothetical protein DSO57_1022984 [Entomophthora muscae]
MSKGMLFILCAVFLLILNSEDIYLPRRFAPTINRVLSEYGIVFDSKAKQIEVAPSPSRLSSSLNVDTEYRTFFQNGLVRFRTSFQRKAAAAANTASSKSKG